MASLTIRNIPDDAKLRLRQIAAAHGRSMEEHVRQMVIEADFGDPTSRSAHLADAKRNFRHENVDAEMTQEDWVRELIKRAKGAGEGVFDRGEFADIRYLSAKDALVELRRLANGVGLDLPPRLNTRREAPEF